MKCPGCDQKFNCPCKSCAVNFPLNVPVWIETSDGTDWFHSCPTCGLTKNVYDWMEDDYKQYQDSKYEASKS